MSNPAVIELASTFIGNTEVRIEDNWAEAIHLHFGMMRIDLTIDEFIDIANKMTDAVNEIISTDNFDVKDYDPIFLSFYSSVFMDLEDVVMDKVRLGDIVILKNSFLPYYTSLNKSRDYKALNGNYDELNSYTSQVNTIGQSNLNRLNNVLQSIKDNGYPYNDEYIILRNDQNVILDGQHRASCLLHLYGPDYEIPVKRFIFRDKKYNVTDWHPWKRALYRKMINFMRRVSHRVSGTGKDQIDI